MARKAYKRRRNNEGSITQRKNGTFQVAYIVGKKADGTPKRVYRSASTEAEANRALLELRYQHARGDLLTAEPMTFGQLAARWLELREPTVKVNTIVSYRGLLAGHILPVIGGLRVDKVKLSGLEDLQAHLLGKGLAPRTVNYAMWLVSAVLESAVRNDLISKSPSTGLQSLRASQVRPARAFTREEAQAFIEAAREERHYVAFFLMLCLGLRRGEVLGLRWQDVDLHEGHLTINCTLRVAKETGYVFDSPKTVNSRRRLYLPPDAVDALRLHKENQELEQATAREVWRSVGTVITTQVGTPVHPDNLRRVLSRICARAGVPKLRIHDLRHTHASLVLRSQLVDDKVLSERLGHSDVRFTRQIYQHTYEEQHRAAALPMTALLGQE